MLWRWLERRFVFFPEALVEATPGDVGLPYEDIRISTADGHTLTGWFIPAPSGGGASSGGGVPSGGGASTGGASSAETQTWLWLHGNGGNIGHRVDDLAIVWRHLAVNLFIFDYRGYGRSSGTASELGLYADARAALEWLRRRPGVNPQRIVYYGLSLGAAAAVALAAEEPPLGLALVAPFASARDMAPVVLPWLRGGGWVVRRRLNSLERIGRVRAPLLVLHGDADATVPHSQGRKLFAAANEPKRFVTLPGAGHGDAYRAADGLTLQALQQFSRELG